MIDRSHQIARLARECHTAIRSADHWYARTRKLEAAIKRHARGDCDCRSHAECLTMLVSLTPAHVRPVRRNR